MVTTIILSRGKSFETRSKASPTRVFFENCVSSCLGSSFVEMGQSLLPSPPAKITATGSSC